jgi:hypothetical protein
MRKRNRHLNKSLRGAACAFDSRFLTGFSDGNAVGTWPDLSANARNATQATGTSQPIYKTAIQGGNPVLRFDGSNDVMSTAAFASPTEVSAVMVAKANSWHLTAQPYRPVANHGHSTSNFDTIGISLCYLAGQSVVDWALGDAIAWGSGYLATSNPRAIGPISSGSNFRIVSTTLWTSTARMYVNGTRTSTRKEATGTIASFNKTFDIGATVGTSDAWSGDIASVIYFTSNIGNAMRARIERSNALAFKIACS